MSEQTRYIVTARKYRPQTFSDLVSQLHVSETIRNAIITGRLAHAYLFSGPRGVGKTTCARLLAKAINCTTSLTKRERGEACRQCESCRNFEEGRSLNIIEIDAASNNSVEDVRALRDKVIIPPQGAKKKVYIIDEVHMLSNAAFNALLKTLEEPPPHALFIFATTEPHKVLPTILSRCQRFDFKRISVADVVARLKEICQLEGFSADEESLVLIAQKGDGALRDSLSAFDQAIALCGTDLHYAALAQALGVISTDLFFAVTDFVLKNDTAGVFQLVHGLMQSGADYQEFLVGLSEHLRNLLVAITTQSGELIEASETVQQRYVKAASQFREPDVLRMLHLVSEGEQAMKTSPQPRLRLEMTLLKVATLPRALTLNVLMQKLDRLEVALKNGNLGDLSIPSVVQSTTYTSSASPNLSAPSVVAEPNPNPVLPTQPLDMRTNPVLPARPFKATATPVTSSATPQPVPPMRAVERPEARSAPVVPAKPTGTSLESFFGAPALKRNPNGAKPALQAVGQPTLNTAPTTAAEGSPSRSNVIPLHPAEDYNKTFFNAQQNWQTFLHRIKQVRIAVHAMLKQAVLDHADRDALVLAVPDALHQEMLEQQTQVLAQELAGVLGLNKPPQLRFFVKAQLQTDAEGDGSRSESDPFQQLQKLSQNNPVVRSLLDTFGGEIVW